MDLIKGVKRRKGIKATGDRITRHSMVQGYIKNSPFEGGRGM